jgi:hypothetical protein
MHPSTQDPEAQADPNTWITEIRTYLKDNILPDDMTSADRIARLAKRYTLIEGDLYRRGTNGVLMRCITWEEGCELLTEVHEGECGNHASSCTLVDKAFRHEFYWPTALQDAVKLIMTCKACQFHTKQIHMAAQTLQMIPLSWPFAVWGLDIMGPFLRAIGGYRFLYVAIDKFTKWPEATPVVKFNKQSAVKFIKSVICRFGVPSSAALRAHTARSTYPGADKWAQAPLISRHWTVKRWCSNAETESPRILYARRPIGLGIVVMITSGPVISAGQ